MGKKLVRSEEYSALSSVLPVAKVETFSYTQVPGATDATAHSATDTSTCITSIRLFERHRILLHFEKIILSPIIQKSGKSVAAYKIRTFLFPYACECESRPLCSYRGFRWGLNFCFVVCNASTRA